MMKNNKDIGQNVQIIIDDLISLRTLVASDVSEKYVVWLNDYEVTKYTEQRYYEHTLDSILDFVTEKYESKNDILFGIFSNNLHIGNIKLGPIRWEHQSAEVSYFIGDRDFWGKGIASKCVRSLVEYAISELSLKKINAGYYDLNIGSAKVLEKCGFNVEGEKLSDIIFEGKRINSILVGYAP